MPALIFSLPLFLPQTLSRRDWQSGTASGVALWECWAAGHSCLWWVPGRRGGGQGAAEKCRVTISGLPAAACRGVSCGIVTDFLAEVARERPTWPGAVCFRSQSLPDLLSLQIYV